MKLLFSIGLLILLSCNWKSEKKDELTKTPVREMELIATYDSIRLERGVKKIIDSFEKINFCKDCIHEMYIDKVLPGYTLITLKVRSYSSDYMKNSKALFKVNIDQTPFYIFCGAEDIFIGMKRSEGLPNDSTSVKYKTWTVISDHGTLKIDTSGYSPFFPSPFLRFQK